MEPRLKPHFKNKLDRSAILVQVTENMTIISGRSQFFQCI